MLPQMRVCGMVGWSQAERVREATVAKVLCALHPDPESGGELDTAIPHGVTVTAGRTGFAVLRRLAPFEVRRHLSAPSGRRN